MSAKYNFYFKSEDRQRPLPDKLILGQNDSETVTHVALKLLAYLLFYRERLQVELNLHSDQVPFTPDLVQLDYELRPKLWVECGECSLNKLNKLAVKVPEAEIWIVKASVADAEHLLRAMAKDELRQNRYQIVALEQAMVDELCGLLQSRNEVFWVGAAFDPANLQFDFNGLWFDSSFQVMRF